MIVERIFIEMKGKKPKDIISVPFMAQCLMSVLMQKPDFARARPSTLLEDDDAYNKLYHKNNDLKTYHFLAHTGRAIEQYVKNTGEYTPSEITDIKFYILYVVCAQLSSNIYPSNKIVSELAINQIDSQLQGAVIFVYDLYKELGGTDKIAKGPDLSEKIKDKLRSRMSL